MVMVGNSTNSQRRKNGRKGQMLSWCPLCSRSIVHVGEIDTRNIALRFRLASISTHTHERLSEASARNSSPVRLVPRQHPIPINSQLHSPTVSAPNSLSLCTTARVSRSPATRLIPSLFAVTLHFQPICDIPTTVIPEFPFVVQNIPPHAHFTITTALRSLSTILYKTHSISQSTNSIVKSTQSQPCTRVGCAR